jgi:hypothetical protein
MCTIRVFVNKFTYVIIFVVVADDKGNQLIVNHK